MGDPGPGKLFVADPRALGVSRGGRAILSQTSIHDDVVIDGRDFYAGTLEGNDVVVGLTGIGGVNAHQAVTDALDHFACAGGGITGIVFSGTSRGRSFIGDVTVPARWTQDESTWFDVDPSMLDVVRSVNATLANTTPLGDPACIGADPDLVRTVTIDHTPEIIVGGDGYSSDPFGGRPFPCIPGGGDVFGCEACHVPHDRVPDVVRFLTGAAPFIDPNFFFGYFANPPATGSSFDAEDMETGAVAEVAHVHGVGFIAFRALSDGKGDPLGLPGFPFEFFVYHQLAADNAAAVALAFLGAWSSR